MRHRQTDKEQRKGTEIYSVADREVETGEETNEGQVKVIGAEEVKPTRAGNKVSDMRGEVSIKNKTGNIHS